MKQWSYDRRIPIDTSTYLEGKTIKAIVDLKFNPGEGIAHILSVSKGLSIMSCQGRTSAETKRICEREEAIAAMENTRQLDKLLHLSKGVTWAPADNFWELKVNIATFMSLMWVLFGSERDYYKGLWNVYATLELKEVMALKSSFTVEHCRRITWAILDNGRVYFDDLKTTLDFRGPDPPMFPQLYLIDIMQNVCYATLVDRANFPDKWKCKVKNPQDKQGGRQTGGGGGGYQQCRGESRAVFGQDMHLARWNTHLIVTVVDTKDNMERGARILWHYPPGTHGGIPGRTSPAGGTTKQPQLAYWVEQPT
jgi:hypothetical protein